MKRRQLSDSEKREYKKIIDIYNSIQDKRFKAIIELLYQDRFESNINNGLRITQLSEKLGLENDVIYDLLEKYNRECYYFVRIYQLSKERWAIWYHLYDDVMDALTLDRTIEGTSQESFGDKYDVMVDLSENERDM